MKRIAVGGVLAAIVVLSGAFALGVLPGCGSSDGGTAPAKTISTDATANKALITNFTGPNSVTLAGTWTNDTYGTTGNITANVVFDPATNVATVTLDVTGNVYGGGDPAPETFTIDLTTFIANGTATLTTTSAVYGDISATLTFYTDGTGTFVGTADNEPTGRVTDAAFTGTFQQSGATVTFAITSATFVYLGTPITCTDTLTSTIN